MLIANTGQSLVVMNLRTGEQVQLPPGQMTPVLDSKIPFIDDSFVLISLFAAGVLVAYTDAGAAYPGFPTSVSPGDSARGTVGGAISIRDPSTSLILNGLSDYGPLTITGATTINVTGAVRGSQSSMLVIANGINVPNISGATEWATSFGYLNVVGAANRLDVWYDGQGARYAWSQAAVTAPGEQILTLTNLNLLTKSGNTYTGQAGTAFTQQGDSGAVRMSGDGYVSIDWPNAANGAVILGLDATAGITDYGLCDCILQLSTSAGTVSQGSNTRTPTSLGSALTPGANVRYRLNRVGTTVTIEQSPDAGASWTVRHTFANSLPGTLTAYAFTVASNTVVNPRQVGMA